MTNISMCSVPPKFYELCRLCLSCEGAKVSIFDDSGTQRNFPMKISACLSILVTEQDMLPSSLCHRCVYKLDVLNEFREVSRKTDAILKQYLNRSEGLTHDEHSNTLQKSAIPELNGCNSGQNVTMFHADDQLENLKSLATIAASNCFLPAKPKCNDHGGSLIVNNGTINLEEKEPETGERYRPAEEKERDRVQRERELETTVVKRNNDYAVETTVDHVVVRKNNEYTVENTVDHVEVRKNNDYGVENTVDHVVVRKNNDYGVENMVDRVVVRKNNDYAMENTVDRVVVKKNNDYSTGNFTIKCEPDEEEAELYIQKTDSMSSDDESGEDSDGRTTPVQNGRRRDESRVAERENNESKIDTKSLLRTLMSAASLFSAQQNSFATDIASHCTKLPPASLSPQTPGSRGETQRHSSGRRKQSCPLRSTEVPFLKTKPTSTTPSRSPSPTPPPPTHHHQQQPPPGAVRPVSRSTEAISRLLEAAHYTERSERGEISDNEADDDIEEVEIESEMDVEIEQDAVGSAQWYTKSVFRPNSRQQQQPSLAKRVDLACSNCGTRTTTIWRRNRLGEMVCNACGLYYKLHNVNRPATMRRDTIHTRRRRPKGEKITLRRNSKKANSDCASGGNSGSDECCDDMLAALRRQIQPHLMLAALQQQSPPFSPAAHHSPSIIYKKELASDETPLNLVASGQ
ncbi:uncharacterized protein LOC111062578 isoform X2 [Nilaparvata lugens]|uniref:uncharacterized protein LOC111062578 isoform X2 n=1 Tax=Nilaparvata lugens TaxID=108931 RepID=UPI00193D4AE9|nr:uncharacterized protein LOC111062578 isoform X2 [Nilaparvata lugens]